MDTMREDFEKAIESVDGDVQDEETATTTEETTEVLNAGDETAATETTDETEAGTADGEGAETKPTDDAGLDASSDTAATDTTTAADAAEKNSKAPAGWTPTERELWGALPAAVQARITKREGEISSALNDGATNRKLGQQYSELATKYQPTFAAEGFANNPLEAFDGLIKVATTMRFGSGQEKAQQIANFIKTYGVDIATLDGLLVGAAPTAEQEQSSQFETLLDERMQPVNQLLQQIQQANTQRTSDANTKASTDLQTFSENAEFISDVRLDMADLMDMAAKRNQPMTLQEAYDKACTLSPEITKVMAERAERERITGSNDSVAAKRAAAASISGNPGGAGGGKGPKSLREEIASQY